MRRWQGSCLAFSVMVVSTLVFSQVSVSATPQGATRKAVRDLPDVDVVDPTIHIRYSGSEMVSERERRSYERHEERLESYLQVGTRQALQDETVFMPVANVGTAAGVPPEGTTEVGKTRSVTSLSSLRAQRNGKPGSVVTATITRFLKTIPDVAAYYRWYWERWQKNLGNDLHTSLSNGATLNRVEVTRSSEYDVLAAAVAKAGMETVRQVVTDRDGDRQSDAMVLIDVDSGEVVGTVPVTSYDPYSLSSLGSMNFTLRTGATLPVNVVAYGTHGSPILFDLSGQGHPDLLAGTEWRMRNRMQLAQGAIRAFDLDGSGQGNWEWVGPKSGILAWDPDHSGQITSGRQLFGNWTWGKRWKDGYQPLATLDENGNQHLEGTELSKLAIWQDLDSDGVSDPGEVRTLEQAGVVQIAVRADRDSEGNAMARAGFTLRDASGKLVERASWDWISLGLAKAREGTYVWVDDDEKTPHGGFLRLRDDAGRIEGFSAPTLGIEQPSPDVLTLLPVRGSTGTDSIIRWTYPVMAGRAESTVRVLEAGRRLVGETRVFTSEGVSLHTWQAQFIAGSPIGPVNPS